MKSLLAILVLASLLLVPTTAAAPPEESAACEAIFLNIHQISSSCDCFYIMVSGAVGPWYIVHGPPASLTYKGCFLYVQPNNILGPYDGDLNTNFFAPPAAMAGGWQVISNAQTSNGEVLP